MLLVNYQQAQSWNSFEDHATDWHSPEDGRLPSSLQGGSHQQPIPGPVFCVMLGVSWGCARPVAGQITSVSWPMFGWAYSEFAPSKRQKMGTDLRPSCWNCRKQKPAHFNYVRMFEPYPASVLCPMSKDTVIAFNLCVYEYREKWRMWKTCISLSILWINTRTSEE